MYIRVIARETFRAQIVHARQVQRLNESPERGRHRVSRLAVRAAIRSGGAADQEREILESLAIRLGQLVERRREGGVGARKFAVLLRRISDERETPTRRRADRRRRGARDTEAVGRLRASGLDEIADALAEDPPIAGDHGAETVEDRQKPSSRRDDLESLLWWIGRDLLEIAVATDDGVAAGGADQRRVRQESPPQRFEVALRPMRETPRARGIATRDGDGGRRSNGRECAGRLGRRGALLKRRHRCRDDERR